jgi:hypothetical protein
VTRLGVVMALLLCWPSAVGASSGIYLPPDAVVVQAGGTLLVARSDSDASRWVSLCVENRDGAIEFPASELDGHGALFGTRLRWTSSGGFVHDDTREPTPVPGEEDLVELPMRWTRAASLDFHTAKESDDGFGEVDYRHVSLVVSWDEGKMNPIAEGEAVPVDRDGVPLPDAEAEGFGIPVVFRARGRCSLPDFRD